LIIEMQFLRKKLLRFILVVLAVTLLTFLMVDMLPGDVAYLLGGEDATSEDIEAVRKSLPSAI